MNLKKLRKRLGFTQRDIAQKIGATSNTVSRWELGKVTPKLKTMIQLSKLFDCTIDELVKS